MSDILITVLWGLSGILFTSCWYMSNRIDELEKKARLQKKEIEKKEGLLTRAYDGNRQTIQKWQEEKITSAHWKKLFEYFKDAVMKRNRNKLTKEQNDFLVCANIELNEALKSSFKAERQTISNGTTTIKFPYAPTETYTTYNWNSATDNWITAYTYSDRNF